MTNERAFSQLNLGACAAVGMAPIKKDDKEAQKWYDASCCRVVSTVVCVRVCSC